MRRVGFLIWKELIELKEDPRLFGLVIVAPILQLFMLGYAATTDVRDVPIVVADADRSSASRDLIARFEASPNFTIVDVVTSTREIDPYLERGQAWMALAIPAAYSETLDRGEPQKVQVIADSRAPAGWTPRGGIEPRVRVWFNPRLESRDFMLPGVLALLLLVITTNLSSMGIVREKELGTLEQLNVTPLRRWELIVGKLLPYALVGLIDVCLVLGIAVLWFDVPLRGSVWLLLGLTSIYL